jgi:hypothetical protein
MDFSLIIFVVGVAVHRGNPVSDPGSSALAHAADPSGFEHSLTRVSRARSAVPAEV